MPGRLPFGGQDGSVFCADTLDPGSRCCGVSTKVLTRLYGALCVGSAIWQ